MAPHWQPGISITPPRPFGFAVLFDGLDGRVARMTGTSSDFGKEFDSLTDVITFGVAPAMLAWTWGFHFMPPIALTEWNIKLAQLGAIASFLFLISGASRLARFNITSNPVPSNPGRPGKKYFVGMPIPAGAGVVAAVVHFQSGVPLEFVVYRSPVARAGRGSGISHGEYLALLQFQGHRFFSAAAFSCDHFIGRSSRRNLVFLQAGIICRGLALHVLPECSGGCSGFSAAAVSLHHPRIRRLRRLHEQSDKNCKSTFIFRARTALPRSHCGSGHAQG